MIPAQKASGLPHQCPKFPYAQRHKKSESGRSISSNQTQKLGYQQWKQTEEVLLFVPMHELVLLTFFTFVNAAKKRRCQ